MILLSKKGHCISLRWSAWSIPRPWWGGFALSLVLPLSTLVFLFTGPHLASSALCWTLPVWALIAADRWGPTERRQVPPRVSPRFFDGLLYATTLLQGLNVLAMGLMITRLNWTDNAEIINSLTDLLVLRILGGTNACCSVIAPAHELIHRRSRWQRRLGRLLLMTVFYEHFYVAHRSGHHARLGSREDPSTSAIDEGYSEFLWRSVKGQLLLAWRLQPRTVLRGVSLQFMVALAYGWAFGPLSLFMWLYVSVVAIRLLEAVNYFQHFGLTQDSGLSSVTAWRCDSAISLFLFMGLPRHADHHRRPWVHYPHLEVSAGGPSLPLGYLGTAIWVKNDCRGYRLWAVRELGRYEARRLPAPGLDTI